MKLSHNKSGWFSGLFAIAFCLLSISGARAQFVWYNGDNNGVDTLFGTVNTDFTGFIYQDFTVASAGGWQVTGVSGNFLLPNTVSYANWAILSGVSTGVGGTVVESGSSSPLTLNALSGPDANGFTLYQVSVTGLSFNLAPGNYWLGLQPISTDDNYGYLVTTSGLNAIGTQAASGNSYYTERSLGGIPLDGKYFENTTTEYPDLTDFSVGVLGTEVTPEPSTSALFLVGLGFLAVYWRRRRARV